MDVLGQHIPCFSDGALVTGTVVSSFILAPMFVTSNINSNRRMCFMEHIWITKLKTWRPKSAKKEKYAKVIIYAKYSKSSKVSTRVYKSKKKIYIYIYANMQEYDTF